MDVVMCYLSDRKRSSLHICGNCAGIGGSAVGGNGIGGNVEGGGTGGAHPRCMHRMLGT